MRGIGWWFRGSVNRGDGVHCIRNRYPETREHKGFQQWEPPRATLPHIRTKHMKDECNTHNRQKPRDQVLRGFLQGLEEF